MVNLTIPPPPPPPQLPPIEPINSRFSQFRTVFYEKYAGPLVPQPPPPPPLPPQPPFRPVISQPPRNLSRRLILKISEQILPPPPPPLPAPPPSNSRFSTIFYHRLPPSSRWPIIPQPPRNLLRRLIKNKREQILLPPPPPPPFVLITSRFPTKFFHEQIINQPVRIVPPPTPSSLNQNDMLRQKLQTSKHKPEETQEQWISTIKEKMKQVLEDEATTSWEKQCIYRIPHYLQENDKKSYSPQTVSLGPYHHGKEHLLPMDYHKWRAVTMVMKRNNQDIELYINAMKELEKRARACYEGPISLNSNEFIEMLVLDGCFVIELFRGASKDKGFLELGYDRNDPVFAMRGSMHSIQRDMIMLENQLPLFVLNKQLELQPGIGNQTVAKIAIRFLNTLMPTDISSTNSLASKKFFDPFTDMGELHCLDVFRRNLLRPSSKPEPKRVREIRVADKRHQQLIHCVTELREAGIRFRCRKTDRFWDIGFENGCLEIPKLLIHHGTKSLFSNLLAFEQCHIDSSNDITSYIVFMNNLIDSAEDVKYLHYHGIIEHWLGNDSEVTDLFNQLCQEVAFDLEDTYLSQVSQNVHQFYNRKWNVMKATLKHKSNFNNPWAYFSFFAALISLYFATSHFV